MGTPEDIPLDELGRRVSAARAATEARGETFYQGASRVHLAAFPPRERWDDWVELSSRAWPAREERHYMLVPTTCFNCESACGLLAYVDRDTGQVRKFEGNPEHPGSRGRNCAKGPATINQVTDPDRILYPMRRSGPRGGGRWERVSWDEALDALAARIRAAITSGRRNEIMVHLGRPGEDGYTERVLASWGVDGHNSHTNVCSSGGRTGFQFWMGIDRPSPDHAHAKVIYLISAHLESGHYFNPHAQRITQARANGAKVIVLDTRLSNTATHADYWLSPQPGSEAAINLAVANYLIQTRRYDRDFVRRWWNWAEYLTACHPGVPVTFEAFEAILAGLYADFTFGFAAAESGIDASVLAEVAAVVADAGSRFSCHSWRSAAAGNLGGWQVARTLFLISALLGAVATEGGTFPNAWNKFVPRPIHTPPHPGVWQELSWPAGVPAGPERDVVPAAALPRRGPRAAGHLLHPRLQPGVDQPRRALAGWRCCVTRTRSAASSRSPRPGTSRPGSPTTCCRWGTAPSGTTPTPTSSTTASGSGSGSRCCGPRGPGGASR